jgi:AcrR family transcriptional regulator
MGVPQPARSPDRILAKALELFARKGYDATSVREICEAAAITKPSLYHFYGSKEGVYHALVEGALSDFRRRVVEQIAGSGPPPDRLRRVARIYFEYARVHPELTRFLYSVVHGPPTSAPRTDFPRYYEGLVELVSQVLEEGVRDGSFAPGPSDLRMLVFMGAVGEAVMGYLIVGAPELQPALADRLVDTILQGWSQGRSPS